MRFSSALTKSNFTLHMLIVIFHSFHLKLNSEKDMIMITSKKFSLIMTNDESWYYTIYGDIWYKSGYSCFLKCEFVNSPNSRRSPFGVRFHSIYNPGLVPPPLSFITDFQFSFYFLHGKVKRSGP